MWGRRKSSKRRLALWTDIAGLRFGRIFMVRKKGLEPPRLAAPDPKSGAATNYATSALGFLLMPQR
jgi:hypothetical protein